MVTEKFDTDLPTKRTEQRTGTAPHDHPRSHADARTTEAIYRRKPERVKPLK